MSLQTYSQQYPPGFPFTGNVLRLEYQARRRPDVRRTHNEPENTPMGLIVCYARAISCAKVSHTLAQEMAELHDVLRRVVPAKSRGGSK